MRNSDSPVLASLTQWRGLSREEFTLTPSGIVIRTQGPLGRQNHVLELNTLARISPVQKPDLSVLAGGAMVGCLLLLVTTITLLHIGFQPLPVVVCAVASLVAGGILGRRVARSRHFVLETWGGRSYPIVFETRSTDEAMHFIDMLQQVTKNRLPHGDEMEVTDGGSDGDADGGAGGGGPRAIGPSMQDALDRLERLLKEKKLTREEYVWRKKQLLEFYEVPPPEEERVVH